MRHEISCDDHGKTKLRATDCNMRKVINVRCQAEVNFPIYSSFFCVDVNPVYGATCSYAKPRSITQKIRNLSAKSESSSCCNKSSQIFSSESLASASDFSKCQLYFHRRCQEKCFHYKRTIETFF